MLTGKDQFNACRFELLLEVLDAVSVAAQAVHAVYNQGAAVTQQGENFLECLALSNLAVSLMWFGASSPLEGVSLDVRIVVSRRGANVADIARLFIHGISLSFLIDRRSSVMRQCSCNRAYLVDNNEKR